MKRLVIAPHVDDDVLGCSSVLDADTVTWYAGVDAFHEVSFLDRHREALAVYDRAGGRAYWPEAWTLDAPDGRIPMEQRHARWTYYPRGRLVNEYAKGPGGGRFLVDDMEGVINEERPSEVFIPYPSFNADHRAVYHAALVALRPHDRNWFVPRVMVYEGSQIAFWDHATPGAQFHANYFVPIDIEEKIARYKLMASQVRSFRSEEHLRALATLRGGEIGVPYAEAFQILRWVGEA